MSPQVFRHVEENPRGTGGLPDHAVIGETVTGWAFAVEPPWCPTEWYRHDVASPTIGASVDGLYDWSYFERARRGSGGPPAHAPPGGRGILRHPVRKVPCGPYDPCPECGAEMAKWNGDGVRGR